MPKGKMSSYGPLSRELLNLVSRSHKYAKETRASLVKKMPHMLKKKAKNRSMSY